MLIVKRVKRESDGAYDVTWKVSEDQMGFLITFAINSLVREGLISIEDVEEVDKEEKQMQLDFLINTNSEFMGNA